MKGGSVPCGYAVLFEKSMQVEVRKTRYLASVTDIGSGPGVNLGFEGAV